MTASAPQQFSVSRETITTTSWSSRSRRYRRIEERDLEHLRRWRNTQQSALRQQFPIDEVHQRRWWTDTVRPSYEAEQPSNFLVVCDGDPAPTSYGGLTNIEWVSGRAELSFLAASEIAAEPGRYAKEFGDFLAWVIGFAFAEVGLRRLFTETWSFRDAHIDVLESFGLRQEGRLRGHVIKDGVVYDAVIHGILANDRSSS